MPSIIIIIIPGAWKRPAVLGRNLSVAVVAGKSRRKTVGEAPVSSRPAAFPELCRKGGVRK